jgi:tetratricopeptide (TPR) repeat protein
LSDLPRDPPAPAPDAEPPDASPADEADFARLSDQAALSLRLGRQAEAERAVAELLKRWPDSTTAQELAGDAAMLAGKIAPARAHYRRALELEPANADAERKYGASLLAQTPEERRAALVHDIIADPGAHRSSARKPLNAIINALIFPGLGQLYNRQHEKGLVVLCAAAVALAVALSVLMPYFSAQFTLSSPNATDAQTQSAQRVLENTGGGDWVLVAIGLIIYAGLYLWGLYDAWKQAQSDTEQALGV